VLEQIVTKPTLITNRDGKQRIFTGSWVALSIRQPGYLFWKIRN